MISLHNTPVLWQNGKPIPASADRAASREKTIAYRILRAHDKSRDPGQMQITFDSLISHDITYVGILQTAREEMSGCGRMILGSDSHTRYGALGTMGIGEGGPEIVKQLLEGTYDIKSPEVVLVYLTGTPQKGVGPHDVAIALCGAVYKNGFVQNKVLEFAGPGIANLPMDYRIGIDVMTTETACLSSIWEIAENLPEAFPRRRRLLRFHDRNRPVRH